MKNFGHRLKTFRVKAEPGAKKKLAQHIVYGETTPGSSADYYKLKDALLTQERKSRNFEGAEWYKRVMFTTQFLKKKEADKVT